MVKRVYGWKRQEPDHRDYHMVHSHRFLMSLPASATLEPMMGPILDQDILGSCGPTSIDEIINCDQKIQNLPVVSASRLFMYWISRKKMGTLTEDSGVDNRTMLKALNQSGFCAESLWPYDENQFTVTPPDICFKKALADRIQNYVAVQQLLVKMKGCIAGGHPFLFGFSCFPGLESDHTASTGIVPDPKKTESSIGGHDVTFFAYDDNGFGKIPGGAFKFRNHWKNDDGSWWGDKGNGYISYNYATNPRLAGDFWGINAVNAFPAMTKR